MGWFRRQNQTTGQEEEVNDETGEVRPVSSPSPLAARTTPAQGATPSGATPGQIPHFQLGRTPIIPNQNPNTRGGRILGTPTWGDIPLSTEWFGNLFANAGNIGVDIANWWNQKLDAQGNPVGQTPQGQPMGPGSTVGADVGNYQPIFGNEDPNALPQLSAVEQAIVDAYSRVGQQAQPAPRPEAPPPVEPDPSLAILREAAVRRQERFDPIIQQMIEEVRARQGERESLPAWRRNLGDFGQWLGRLASTHDLAQGGRVLYDMREERRQREQGWMNDILRLTEAGYSLQDAITQADAAVASGAHQASQATANRGYEHAMNVADRADASMGLRAQLGLGQAEALQSALSAAEGRNQQAIEALGQIEGYEGVAAGQQAQRLAPNNEALQRALSGGIARQARLLRVAQRLAGPYANRGDFRDLARQARRIDPSLTDQDIQTLAQILSAAPAQ